MRGRGRTGLAILRAVMPPIAPTSVRCAALGLLLPLALLAGCERLSGGAARAALEPCRLPGLEREARCGTVSVPADPAAPEGKKFAVRYAVLPALARIKLDDPVFVLAGGPGQAATGVAGQVAPIFDKLNARRDLVFVDQRGTGASAPFACPQPASEFEEFDAQRAVERLRECARAATIDPALLPTWIATRDLEAVRAALGAEQINLWGASYGTRAALDYLRQFPQRVRSVVLDGAAPPDMALPAAMSVDADAALEAALARCAADPACSARYPDLRATVARLLDQAAQGQRISVADPLTGRRTELALSPTLLAALLRAPLYVPTYAAVLPYALAEAGAGRFEPLAALAAGLAGPVSRNFAEGMHYAVVCAEDLPRIDAAARQQAAATRLGTTIIELYAQACGALRAGAVPAEFYTVPASRVPVLILSGGADPATPPRHGEAVAQRLGNALHLVAPQLGHGVSGAGCAPDLIARFVRQASFDGIDGACLQKIPAPSFFQPLSRP
jgi:pimeloyl-ACP methyl ester carboxylesterase